MREVTVAELGLSGKGVLESDWGDIPYEVRRVIVEKEQVEKEHVREILARALGEIENCCDGGKT